MELDIGSRCDPGTTAGVKCCHARIPFAGNETRAHRRAMPWKPEPWRCGSDSALAGGLKLNLQAVTPLRVGRRSPIYCRHRRGDIAGKICCPRVRHNRAKAAYSCPCAENRAACRPVIDADSCHSSPTRFPTTRAKRGHPARDLRPNPLTDNTTSTHNLIRPSTQKSPPKRGQLRPETATPANGFCNQKPSLHRAGFTIEDTLVNHKHDTDTRVAPCLQHPGDWLDPKRRTFTRQQCLGCPSLVRCSRSALRHEPSYGMWAGVWIDGDFPSKKHLLGLPAQPPADTKPVDHQPVTPSVTPAARYGPRPGRRVRVGKLLITTPVPLIAAQITARASGHCEIMAPACRYQQAAIFSRRRRAHPRPLASPADAIAACRNCIELIEHTDIPTALDLGYLVDPRSTTSTTAMLWRQHRWVFLDTHGRVHDTTDLAVTHTAS